MKKRSKQLLAIAVFILPNISFSAPNVDAGSLRQQIERNQRPTLPHKVITKKPAAPISLPLKTGATVTVTSFYIVGNTLLNIDQVAPALEGFFNRPLDFTQLQAAAAAVANVYRQAGWVVRTYLPPQDIVRGIVAIQVVEANLGETQIHGQIHRIKNSNHILKIISRQQKMGEPINTNILDRALLLTDDLPGISATARFSEGQNPRETNLDLDLVDEPLTNGNVLADNTGSRATGIQRLTAALNLNSPFGQGDLISANVSHTAGSRYVQLKGTLPAGDNGWRLGVNTSYLNYTLTAPEFSALDAHGTSKSWGVESSFPMIRSRLQNLYFNINADHKNFDNLSSGATTTHYTVNNLILSFNANQFDEFWGGGANTANLSFTRGLLNLNNSPNQADDAATTQTAGHFNKLLLSLNRQQSINDQWSASANINLQRTNKNLDSSEQFYLGGSNGVRAYPANEGSGAEGELATVELHRRLNQTTQFTAFYDYGHVVINANNEFTGAPARNDYALQGVGASLAWQWFNRFTLQATYAHRLNNNQNSTAEGNDQDGTLIKNRFWLIANLPF